MNPFAKHIANALSISEHQVEATLKLLDEGCTIPFIARYRKERTGNLDEVQITRISELNAQLKELEKRKATILKTIAEQEKLTPELERRIRNCWNATELEDIYLPFKPRRRTRAQVAREQGLEPLATILLLQREANPAQAAKRFVKGDVADVEAALAGAKDIIAEGVSENEQARNTVRAAYRREAVISAKVVKKMAETDEAQKFADYFDFSEPLRRCSSHRLLAMRRGQEAGVLRVGIAIADEDPVEDRLRRQFVRGRGACQSLVGEAVEDAFRRLIDPSIENEFTALSKEKADEEAIHVFAENLRQLLLSAPLGQKRVMAIDPGFANGCKIACLDAQGNLLHHEILYPHPPKRHRAQATVAAARMVKDFAIEAIAIGNGTASRETRDFVDEMLDYNPALPEVSVFTVSEDGASIYSASPTAREEFPDEDVTTRGAVSIGRRLMDPLAELVKIDPKSIGVGQYQHDVDQANSSTRSTGRWRAASTSSASMSIRPRSTCSCTSAVSDQPWRKTSSITAGSTGPSPRGPNCARCRDWDRLPTNSVRVSYESPGRRIRSTTRQSTPRATPSWSAWRPTRVAPWRNSWPTSRSSDRST